MTTKQTLRVLVLAKTPEGRPNNWRPFPKSHTLGQMAERHFSDCRKRFQNWLPEDVDEYLEPIEILPNDLATVSSLKRADYKTINVLLAHVDDLSNAPELINRIKAQVDQRPYYLPQISANPAAGAVHDRFVPLPMITSTPEVMHSQAELEAYFDRFCEVIMQARSTFSRLEPDLIANVSGKDAVVGLYRRYQPTLAAQAREIIIGQNLSEDAAQRLLQAAAVQEFALLKVQHHRYQETKRRVSLKALRPHWDQLLAQALQAPSHVKLDILRPVELVDLQLKQSWASLKPTHRDMLAGAGLKIEGQSVLFYDQPGLRNQLGGLGKAVTIKTFTADLPKLTITAAQEQFKLR